MHLFEIGFLKYYELFDYWTFGWAFLFCFYLSLSTRNSGYMVRTISNIKERFSWLKSWKYWNFLKTGSLMSLCHWISVLKIKKQFRFILFVLILKNVQENATRIHQKSVKLGYFQTFRKILPKPDVRSPCTVGFSQTKIL